MKMVMNVVKPVLLGALLCLCLVVCISEGKTAEEWKSRVVYQILTDRFAGPTGECKDLNNYCGGTFKGITDNLDYLEGLGVNAIWISPIPENTPGGYHGYWMKNIYNINEHFGTVADLEELIAACHARDIWVMLDVVANHMGYQGPDPDNFTMFTPFDKAEYYHKDCSIDWNNRDSVKQCRLAGLPDLDQSNPFVRKTLIKWVKDVVELYDFDGIRIDTIPEVPKDFWSEYTDAAKVYSIGEAFSSDPYYIASFQGHMDATLNYDTYYMLKCAFTWCGAWNEMSMFHLRDAEADNKLFGDSTIAGLFIDNHDNPRFLSFNPDWNILKNALSYIMFAEGIPFMYYGTEQGFNGGNEHYNRWPLWDNLDPSHDLYQFISTIAKFRNERGCELHQSKSVERYVDKELFAFTRAKVFIALTNIGSDNDLSRSITYHPYRDGTILVNLFNSEDTIEVWGDFTVTLQSGLPKVYYPLEA